jgi:hypothetical protein
MKSDRIPSHGHQALGQILLTVNISVFKNEKKMHKQHLDDSWLSS